MKYVIKPTNNDILHFGKGHDDNPPGRGSGRFPWGSGKSNKKSAKVSNKNPVEVKNTKYEVDKDGWIDAKYTKGKDSINALGDQERVNKEDIDKVAKYILDNKEQIYDKAFEAIMEDPYIYNATGKNLGMPANTFKNKLDIKSFYVGKFSNGNYLTEIHVYEKDGSYNILGGHSLDMEIELDNPNYKPKWVAMNG